MNKKFEIYYLEWDSNFFSLKIGKIEIYHESSFDVMRFLESAELENYDLIYVIKFGEFLPINKSVNIGLFLMDSMVTMSLNNNIQKNINNPFLKRNSLTEKELTDCYRIAEQTSYVSRFANDPLIGSENAKKLYRKWVDSAVNGEFCDGIFLEKNNDDVIGIHLIKTDFKNKIGHCSIIGVLDDTKGSGIGSKLWNQALGYWSLDGINKCTVPFSIQNLPSFNFHLKIGFNKVIEVKNIYHYRKNKKHENSI